MPDPNNNKTVANANLQFSNMGSFHNPGREEGMAIFKHSRGKTQAPCQLYSRLLTAQVLLMAYGYF